MIVNAPEWTLSGDSQQPRDNGTGGSKHMDGGLPRNIPATTRPGVAAAQENVMMRPDGHRQKPTGRHRPATTKRARVHLSKKVAVHEQTRPTWAAQPARNDGSGGISQTSATMLFQCTCQLLRNQTLDYDVRAREMEERNAAQIQEMNEWEHRICSLKRELEEYADEQLDETTDTARVDATHRSTTKAMHEQRKAMHEQRKALPSPVFGSMETSLPPGVIAAETKVQDELRKRRQKMKEFWKSIPGFLQSQDEQIAHYF